MKTPRLVAVLVNLAVITLLVTDASAMYHPSVGRFLQRDPGPDGMMAAPRVGTAGPVGGGGFLPRDPAGTKQFADGANLYECVGSNPLGYADPFGTQKENVKKITFTVKRTGGTYASLGLFTMQTEGIPDVSGFTLELRKGKYDIGIRQGAKEYPIPEGTYEAEPAPGAKGGAWGLRLKEVPNFEEILVHVGNWPWDTWACILVGTSQVPNMNFTINQMKAEHRKKWGFYRDLGFLKETKAEPPQEGITDFVGGSNAALIKMREHYDAAVKKHGGVKCVTIVVIVKAVKAVG